MYKIGILSSSTQLEGGMMTFFQQVKETTKIIKIEKLADQLNGYDGIIIHEEMGSNFSRICECFLATKASMSSYIWIYSEQPSSINRQIYLQLGADGIFEKTQCPEEIILHVKNALDRQNIICQENLKKPIQQSNYSQMAQKVNGNDFKLNSNNLSIEIANGESSSLEVRLTRLEYQLLKLLYSKPCEAFSYKEISTFLWGEIQQETTYRISNLVFHIRDKLISASISPKIISTVRSKGYMLNLSLSSYLN